MSRVPSRLLSLLCLLLVCSVCSCAVWKPVSREQIHAVIDERPGKVAVKTQASVLFLRRPSIQADTLNAVLVENNRDSRPVSIPLSSVQSLYMRRTDRNRTRAFVGTAVFASVVVFAIITEPKLQPGRP